MGKIRRSLYEMFPESNKKFDIPLSDRTLDEVINLQDLDIKIKKGSFVVIVGETGSGKTSLLNALIGEMIHLPKSVIEQVGDRKRSIKSGELRYLEDALLHTDLSQDSPITMHGTTGYCEQQAWI